MKKDKRFRVTYRLRMSANTDILVNTIVEGGRIWQAQTRSWDNMVEFVKTNWGWFDAEFIKRITVVEIR